MAMEDGFSDSKWHRCINGKTKSQQQHAAREYHRREKLRKKEHKIQFLPPEQKSTKLQPKHEIDGSVLSNLKPEPEDVHLIPSPRNLLGAGRVDPLNTYAVQDVPLYVHEIVDHALSHQWSVFRFSDDEKGLNTIKSEVVQSIMASPVAWHTIVFAGATHMAYKHGAQGTSKRHQQLRLLYKNKAISCMLEEIKRTDGDVSEETLRSMITLAAHGTGESLEGSRNAGKTRLSSMMAAHDCDYYTSMDCGWQHLNAVYALVDKRGGLPSFHSKSTAMAIQLYDILASWIRLIPPHFPLIGPAEHFLSLRMHAMDTESQSMVRQMSKGFKVLPNDGHELDSIIRIAKHASIISADLDQYLRMRDRKRGAPDIVLIRFTRFCVVCDLLNLPDWEVDRKADTRSVMFELCRLIVMAYSSIVLLPAQPSSGLYERIANRLQHALTLAVDAGSSNGVCHMHPDLFLAATIWGGICAQRMPSSSQSEQLLQYFSNSLGSAAVKIAPHAWSIVAGIMKTYLWLDVDCDEPGQQFWTYACRDQKSAWMPVTPDSDV